MFKHDFEYPGQTGHIKPNRHSIQAIEYLVIVMPENGVDMVRHAFHTAHFQLSQHTLLSAKTLWAKFSRGIVQDIIPLCCCGDFKNNAVHNPGIR